MKTLIRVASGGVLLLLMSGIGMASSSGPRPQILQFPARNLKEFHIFWNRSIGENSLRVLPEDVLSILAYLKSYPFFEPQTFESLSRDGAQFGAALGLNVQPNGSGLVFKVTLDAPFSSATLLAVLHLLSEEPSFLRDRIDKVVVQGSEEVFALQIQDPTGDAKRILRKVQNFDLPQGNVRQFLAVSETLTLKRLRGEYADLSEFQFIDSELGKEVRWGVPLWTYQPFMEAGFQGESFLHQIREKSIQMVRPAEAFQALLVLRRLGYVTPHTVGAFAVHLWSSSRSDTEVVEYLKEAMEKYPDQLALTSLLERTFQAHLSRLERSKLFEAIDWSDPRYLEALRLCYRTLLAKTGPDLRVTRWLSKQIQEATNRRWGKTSECEADFWG